MTGQSHSAALLRQLPSPENPGQRQPCYPLNWQAGLLLGRDPRCQIVLDPLVFRTVSRRHAEVSPILGFNAPDGQRFWQVCDLNSANGTFVNGQRIKGCQVLQPGDRIMLGQNGPEFLFEYEAIQPPVQAVPASLPKAAAAPATTVKLPPMPPPRRPGRRSAPLPRGSGLPADHEPVSLTQLFPILSTGRELTQKAYLLPGSITVGFVVFLFLAVGNPITFNLLLAAYLAGAAFYFIYQLCGKHKPWWLLAGASLMTVLVLLSPVLSWFVLVFRQILPGQLPTPGASVSFPALLVKMFFGAGLMEELLKALPVLATFALGSRLRSPYRERLGVWEPLDGILLGSASAVGFTLVETLGQYIPEIYQATLDAGEGAAQLASLQLLIPRVLGSVSGHMAYSGYLGYFIGLSVLRPRKRWLILSVGYLTAAGLHALWNVAGGISPVLLALIGLLSYAFLAAAILKARALSPNRSQNFATRLR